MRVKKAITYIGIALILYYMYSKPTQSADAVAAVIDGIFEGADSISEFATRVISRVG